MHRAGKNKTFFPTNHGSQLLRYKFIGFLKTAYWCMVVGGRSITTPRDLYTAYSTNQGTVRVYIKCLITTYRGICDPWLLGEKVSFPPILCTVIILKDLSATPCICMLLEYNIIYNILEMSGHTHTSHHHLDHTVNLVSGIAVV